ncbi:MAG: patatin [Stappia sp.]|uniref:patatin-like protein n=1 Tax=Stappia sp. TaxID=1870903 RepID=UPI000C55A46B|nr:patatin-like protein [Stappia sp.]MAA99855.1 patatin [Stappia sp.]MBM21280.1 patatin [Stappia sp.]
MRQIELRLALVLYGGVSLAVYMHGITREFLSLVRAARRQEGRTGAGRNDGAGTGEGSIAAYEAFLEMFRPGVDLRVVVDVIAGASAGGVNGVMLARALAHNLSLDSHRDLWLENADVTRLAGEPVGLTRYLKGSIAPVLDRLVSMALKAELTDPETRLKLHQFMQARWFTPPFSGERYVGWMLDACQSMTPRRGPGETATGNIATGEPVTLIPQGQSLDLFVTVTDFHGARRRFPIEDGGSVEEIEHRRILHYGARRRGNGLTESDFTDESIPDLVFSARATSSFPGAFPPMTVAEMDRVLAGRGEPWPRREAFLARAFADCGGEGAGRVLVDGSVVMNKPFQPVLEAIAGRPAAREVVRRIVYVDPLAAADGSSAVLPSPTGAEAAAGGGAGFFRVILASLAHIPRNEPIGDALDQVAEHNREAARVAEVLAAAEPVVEEEVRSILRGDGEWPMTVRELRRCRNMANERAHVFAGFASHGYQRLKLSGLVERIARLAAELAQEEAGPEKDAIRHREVDERRLAAALDAWLSRRRRTQADPASVIGAGASAPSGTPEPVVAFLRALDVDYRIRRLRFVIRRLNGLYRLVRPEMEMDPARMDELKSTLYEQIDDLALCWQPTFHGRDPREAARALLALCETAKEGEGQAEELDRGTDAFLARLGESMELSRLDRLADDIFSVMVFNNVPVPLRRPLESAYLGFAFYDLVTFPVLGRTMMSEFNAVRVDRISPSDGTALRPAGVDLKGRSLNAFGAFFNRRWREHDYLWGRLSAADRLMTICERAVAEVVSLDPGRALAARRRVFAAILDEEAPHLTSDPDLVPGLLAEVEAMLAHEADERLEDTVPGGAPLARTGPASSW